MWALRWQKSIQKHRPLSFFQTNTTALHHALCLGKLCLNPTSLTGVYGLLPPMVGEFIWIVLWMGYCQWLWSHVQLNEYSQVCWALRRRHHGTQPRDTGQNPSAWVARFPIYLNPGPWIISPVFASQLIWVFGGLGSCPMPPSYQFI